MPKFKKIMDNNSNLNNLSKDIVTTDDIIKYMEASIPNFDYIADVNRSNTGTNNNPDIELINKLKNQNLSVIKKLQNNEKIEDNDKKFLIQTLEFALMIGSSDKNFNKKGIDTYLKLLNNLWKI